ncbi:MAG TPA: APC family permease [Coriobacteriia bacterium]
MAAETSSGGMKRTLTLTGVTVNAMSFIAPGAFLWTTFQLQAAQSAGGGSTAADMVTGLLFAIVLAFLTAYAYAELARIYPGAGAGSSYYYAEAALLDKDKPQLRRFARLAKVSLGWISHLYYWVYPGIMVAFTATLFGYLWTTVTHQTLSFPVLAVVAVAFAALSGYIAYRGISGSTNTALVITVIQLAAIAAFFGFAIYFRATHPAAAYELPGAAAVFIPHNFLNVLYQSTIAILLLVGFESVTALGAEAINPDKDIKRGVLISLAIQGVIAHIAQYFAANFVISGQTITATTAAGQKVAGYAAAAVDSAPLGTMLTNMVNSVFGGAGTAVAVLFSFTVLLALIGTTLACLNGGVRITYSMARDKEMPSILGLLHGKFATPHAGIWILAAVSAAFGVYGVYSVDTVTQITLASNFGTFLVYGITCLIAIVAFASHKDRSILKHYLVPGLGLLMNVAELVGIVYLAVTAGGATANDAFIAIGMVAVWIVAGIVWVATNPAMRGSKLLHDPGRRVEATAG